MCNIIINLYPYSKTCKYFSSNENVFLFLCRILHTFLRINKGYISILVIKSAEGICLCYILHNKNYKLNNSHVNNVSVAFSR